MQLKEIKCVIFDYDYTLVDSSKGILACASHALNQLDLSSPSYDHLKTTIGHSLEDTYTLLTNDHDQEKRNHFKKFYIEKADLPNSVLTQNTFLLEGAKQFIEKLFMANIKLGIVTTKTRFALTDSLKFIGLAPYFCLLQGRDDVQHAKPHPEGLNRIIEELQLAKHQIIYIGDSIIDAQTATHANVPFIRVTTGQTTKEELQNHRHLAVLENLEKISEFLNFHYGLSTPIEYSK